LTYLSAGQRAYYRKELDEIMCLFESEDYTSKKKLDGRYVVDRFIITLINRKQITGDDFIKKESGAFIFTEAGSKKFINLWQQKIQESITHPYINEKISLGLMPYVQAQLLARTLRGDMKDYPPVMVR